jgi:hypothetical protein
LIRVSWSGAVRLLFGWCDNSWWPSATWIQFISAMPTELVNCSEATRAKSAAQRLPIRSICIRAIHGMFNRMGHNSGESL